MPLCSSSGSRGSQGLPEAWLRAWTTCSRPVRVSLLRGPLNSRPSHRPRPASSASRSASAGSWDAGTPFTSRARRSGRPAARPRWPGPRTRWVGPSRGLPPARRELLGNRRRRVASGGLPRAEGRVRPRAVPGAGPASAAGPFLKPGRPRPPQAARPAPAAPRPHGPTPPRPHAPTPEAPSAPLAPAPAFRAAGGVAPGRRLEGLRVRGGAAAPGWVPRGPPAAPQASAFGHPPPRAALRPGWYPQLRGVGEGKPWSGGVGAHPSPGCAFEDLGPGPQPPEGRATGRCFRDQKRPGPAGGSPRLLRAGTRLGSRAALPAGWVFSRRSEN